MRKYQFSGDQVDVQPDDVIGQGDERTGGKCGVDFYFVEQ